MLQMQFPQGINGNIRLTRPAQRKIGVGLIRASSCRCPTFIAYFPRRPSFVRLALTARAALHQRQRRQHQDQTGQQRQAGHRHALTDGTLFELAPDKHRHGLRTGRREQQRGHQPGRPPRTPSASPPAAPERPAAGQSTAAPAVATPRAPGRRAQGSPSWRSALPT
ncbi:hypothetical protein BANRA_05228 [Klebsiella pneumoniae]|nr:hypothetical protein BANRA_05228 [Klebsiella pneumoniae]